MDIKHLKQTKLVGSKIVTVENKSLQYVNILIFALILILVNEKKRKDISGLKSNFSIV